jgi:hypothetical protein
MAELQTLLTPRLQAQLKHRLTQLQAETHWHGDLPVLLLDRSWLRLSGVPVQRLAQVLPPDASAEAPELVRFRQLQRQGLPELEAQTLCWEEFGRQACADALRRFWWRQERGNHGWTLEVYLDLLNRYRLHLDGSGPTPLPMLILAREGSQEPHRLQWFWPDQPPMRHTCR